jgi:hypothetical protein
VGCTLKSLEDKDLQLANSDSATGDSGACAPACTLDPNSDPALAEIVEAWPALPDHIRLAISALVSAAKSV